MKNKSIFLLILISSLYSTQAYTEESSTIKNDTSSQEVSDRSSAGNRKNKTHMFTAQPVGFGPSRGYDQFAVTAGQYLDSDSLVTLDITSGRGSFTFFSDEDIKTSSVGVSYKSFVSNSFYVKSGVDYRTVDYRVKDYVLFGSSNLEQKFKGESLTLSVSIGNQWQFEKFTLGCDWVGYSAPIYSSVHDISVTGTPTESDKTHFKDEQDYYTKDAALSTLVRFYLGVSI